ncbi:hypothetical protein QWJ26_36535 [Streptomyces sp. CSDS2]|nr:hypothetical protein [Streptomyces sp. CSDS2]MDN3265222.1 hypothetical protein [Streptomyces sp. CSDS2]
MTTVVLALTTLLTGTAPGRAATESARAVASPAPGIPTASVTPSTPAPRR